jgi:hypothetical protein
VSNPVPDPDASDDELLADAVTLGQIADAAAETTDPALLGLLGHASEIVTKKYTAD